MFTRDEARWFSETVRTLYTAENTAGFVGAASAAVYERFRLCSSSYEEISLGASSYFLHGYRSENPVPADHAAYFHDCPFMPLLSLTRIPPVWHMRQQLSFAAWARTDHYNGIARPMGWNDHLVLVGSTKPMIFMMGLQRDTRFSPRERELFCLLQPHVAAVWARVRPPLSPRELAPLRISLSAQLRPYFLDALHRKVLRAYFPRWHETDGLPFELERWIAHSLWQLQHEPPRSLHAFAIASARGRLLVRCFPSVAGGPIQLALVEIPARPDFFQLRSRGLTNRECEVLHWVVQGKRDAEIAVIIGAAAKTVSKHMERVLHKLQSGNRATAAKMAVTWLLSE